ncbi:MAG: hypothetical protein ABIJ08_00450 [Nanoarchaeota archaeon]
MKKDLNFILLALILGIVIALVGFTVFYQNMFEGLSNDYTEKVSKLEKVTEELGVQKTKLNQTSFELEIKEQKETDLSTRYSDLRDENVKLEDDIATLGKELTEKKAELIESQAELTKKALLLSQAQDDLSEANSKITLLTEQRNIYKDDYDECKAELDICQGN